MADLSRKMHLVGLIRGLSALIIALYFFFSLVPAYYVTMARLPPSDQLNVSEGTLIFDWMGEKGYLTGIKQGADEEFFTCAGWVKSNNDCIDTPNPRVNYAGRHAKVWWFEQPVYFSRSYRRIARLEVDGQPEVLYEKTSKRMQWASHYAPLWSAGFLLFSLIGVVFCEITARKMIENG